MTYELEIMTADGVAYKGEAQKLLVRTAEGDICILPRHINFVAPVGMGEAVIVDGEGKSRRAACIGGMVSVMDGAVKLLPTTFEWAESIDVDRAKRAEDAARERLTDREKLSERDVAIAEAKLKRALVRQGVGKRK